MTKKILTARVSGTTPGLCIRDCARGCNHCAQMRAQLSAIGVIAKTFFERLYLVLGLRKIALCVSCPCASTQLRHIISQPFLDFCAIFFPELPLIFLVITIHQVIWPSPGISERAVPDPSIVITKIKTRSSTFWKRDMRKRCDLGRRLRHTRCSCPWGNDMNS